MCIRDSYISLYSSDKTVIHTSPVHYHTEELSLTVTGMENNTQYYIKAFGQTVTGMQVETDFFLVSVRYLQPTKMCIRDSLWITPPTKYYHSLPQLLQCHCLCTFRDSSPHTATDPTFDSPDIFFILVDPQVGHFGILSSGTGFFCSTT